MRELSLNMLDITENSLKAKATKVEILLKVEDDVITMQIKDNGCGMTKEFLQKVTDPFTTTRTTRKVGLGIPLIKMQAEMSGGTFDIKSEVGVGTVVTTTFDVNHIDRPPIGNVGETIVTLLTGLGETQLVFSYSAFGQTFTLDTDEIKDQLDGIAIDEPEILVFIKQMVEENITTINGGIVL